MSIPCGKGCLNLGGLFDYNLIWRDDDLDGYPDRVGLSILTARGLNDTEVWAGLINLCARLAWPCLALSGPLAKPLSGYANEPCLIVRNPSPGIKAAVRLKRIKQGWELSGHSGVLMGSLLNSLAVSPLVPDEADSALFRAEAEAGAGDLHLWNKEGKELGSFTLGDFPDGLPSTDQRAGLPVDSLLDQGLLISQDKEARSSAACLCLKLSGRTVSPALGLSLCGMGQTLGLAATDITLPLAAKADEGGGPGVVFIKSEIGKGGRQAELMLNEDGSLHAFGEQTALARLLPLWLKMALDADGTGDAPAELKARISEMAAFIQGKGEKGEWAGMLCSEAGPKLPPVRAGLFPAVKKACAALGISTPGKERKPKALRRVAAFKSELAEVEKLAAKTPLGSGPLTGLVMVSKSRHARVELQARLEAELRARGYRPLLTVINSYKPGLSWLLEVVLPKLRGLRDVAGLHLSFRPFEAAPSQLEKNGRWLQEAFPGPDLILKELGLKESALELRLDSHQTEAYKIQAFDKKGRVVLKESLSPSWTEMPFLKGRPEEGTVHPTVNSIRLRQGGKVLLDHDFPNERLAFWRLFQNKWLPDLEKAMRDNLPGLKKNRLPAFWEEIRIQAAFDESDERLALGDERICPMEALHEDLYFGLLAFFRVFRKEQGLEAGPELGRVVPLVSSKAGEGKPFARLITRPCAEQAPAGLPVDYSAGLCSLNLEGGRLLAGFKPGRLMADQAQKNSFLRIAEAWGYKPRADQAGRVLFPVGRVRQRKPTGESPSERPPVDRIVGVEQSRELTWSLGGLPNLRARKAGSTIRGRDITVLEAVAGSGEGSVFSGKARLLRNTLMVNARHHANEVSGTNAALLLAWLAENEAEHRELLKKVNLVIVPMENADGAATLEELLPEAPSHKNHAARYNAFGMEWYPFYHHADPPFPEPRVKAALWEKWLPEFMVDLHGVPSHEWDQPFSGYLCKGFEQHWIPRSFVYVILPFVTEAGHPGRNLAHELADRMAEQVQSHEDIMALSRKIDSRYQRYARDFDPDTFPASVNKGLMVVPAAPASGSVNFSAVHWPITKLAAVTEVLDEVARGPWLEKCVRAHLAVIKAMMLKLAERAPAEPCAQILPRGGVRFHFRRAED